MNYRLNCRYLRGDIPCDFHKQEGVHCDTCPHYDPVDQRILIIKLGAIGDVIRTTPLLHKLGKVYPRAEVTWLTRSPEVVPSCVDRILPFNLESVVYLQAMHFDRLYNLDKDREACALTRLISSEMKKGFGLEQGKCVPIDPDAEHKYLTGLFDDVNRTNIKSYLEEIFEICGFSFAGEPYVLENPNRGDRWEIGEPSPLVGLNTGCGDRWPTRLWPEKYWVDLARALKGLGVGVLMLGGEREDAKNRRIAQASRAAYIGHFPISRFISLVDQCDVVITSVTMALHVAIGLAKPVVLFNNVFNRNEFELYGRGEILEPDVGCLGCYRRICEMECMRHISVKRVVEACLRWLPDLGERGRV